MRLHSVIAILATLVLVSCADRELPTSTSHLRSSLTAAAYDCTAQSQIPQSECEALVALYNGTNGPAWINNSGWLENNTPCAWYGVRCLEGSVWVLSLNNNQLTGVIPPEIANLSNLENLSLASNQLTSSIPRELGTMSSLVILVLSGNQLTGSIPAELGTLSALETLGLASNNLTGSIPPELGTLVHVVSFNLSGNRLAGSIPPELGNLAGVEFLRLDSNQLTGSIPPELARAHHLLTLNLSNNHLTGSIPSELGNLSDLGILDLSVNQLGGLLPLPVAALGGSLSQGGCVLRPGNLDLFLPDAPAYRAHDVDGDGEICALPFTPITAAAPLLAAEIVSAVHDLRDANIVNSGQANALTRKIEQALKLFEKEKYAAAVAVLKALIEQVNELTDEQVLASEQAQALIARAERFIQLIEAASSDIRLGSSRS